MALSLRFAEEAEFTSRACNASYDEEEVEKEPVHAIFRWSKEMRTKLGTQPMTTTRLMIATMGAPQLFLEQSTHDWRVEGTLVVTDQKTPMMRFDPSHVAACQILWNERTDEMAVLVPTSISSSAVWPWTKSLLAHIHADSIIVLDAQLSTIHDFGYGEDDTPLLRSLSTDSASSTIVPTLETPRMLTGITAALLTLGQLHHHRVSAYVSLYSANAVVSEIVRNFSLLQELFSSRKSLQSSRLVDAFHALYT